MPRKEIISGAVFLLCLFFGQTNAFAESDQLQCPEMPEVNSVSVYSYSLYPIPIFYPVYYSTLYYPWRFSPEWWAWHHPWWPYYAGYSFTIGLGFSSWHPYYPPFYSFYRPLWLRPAIVSRAEAPRVWRRGPLPSSPRLAPYRPLRSPLNHPSPVAPYRPPRLATYHPPRIPAYRPPRIPAYQSPRIPSYTPPRFTPYRPAPAQITSAPFRREVPARIPMPRGRRR